jgi:cell division protein FtsL
MRSEKKFYSLTDAEFAFMAAVAVIMLILTWRYVW